MLRCRLVTFDVVNTLLKVTGSPGHQYMEVAGQHGLRLNDKDIMKVYRPMLQQMKADFPKYGINSNLSTKQWWDIFVRRILRQFAPDTSDETMGGITETLWERFSDGANWEVLPHSSDVLHNLKDRGFKMAAISNFDERLMTTLKKQSLSIYFDYVVTVISARAEKPDPQMFLSALRQAGVPANEAVHIGDDTQADYFGAKRVGMNALLLDSSAQYRDIRFGVREEDVLTDIRQLTSRLSLIT